MSLYNFGKKSTRIGSLICVGLEGKANLDVWKEERYLINRAFDGVERVI